MRILVVHSIYHPYKKGGAEVVVEKFVDELKRTHEVTVLTTSRTGGYVESDEDGVRVVRFSPFNIFSIHDIDQKLFWQRIVWHALDVWNVHSWFVMKKVLKKYQPDVVWTHTMKGVGYLPLKAVKSQKSKVKSQMKWILTPHNEEYVYQFGYGLPPFKIGIAEKFTMLFTRWFTKGPDLIFSPSKYIQDFYRGLGFWGNVPGSWDWPAFNTFKVFAKGESASGGQSSKFKVEEKISFTLGFIGQLEEHKGVRHLIDAFRSYQNPNVRLLIAGRGNLADYVVQESKHDPRITFFGEYKTSDLETLFESISILVVPSTIRDNMPTVILESFAYGRPVIGSGLGGIPEIIKHKNTKTQKHVDRGILLNSFDQGEFHRVFDEVQRPEVYSKLVQAVSEWKPLSVGESLSIIGL